MIPKEKNTKIIKSKAVTQLLKLMIKITRKKTNTMEILN